MSGEQIRSNTVVAEAAVNELLGINTAGYQNQTVDFNYSSGIAGMDVARVTNNELLNSVCEFTEAVLQQANKFPKLDAKFEEQDRQDAEGW